MSKFTCISSSRSTLHYCLQYLTVPLLLGLVCFLVYNANLRLIGSGDTVPTRYLPLILWHDGTLDLDANARLVANGHPTTKARNRPATAESKVTYLEPPAYWMVRTHQHQLASLYPVVTSLIVSPLYLPAVVWLNVHGWEQPHIDRVAILMEKISASLLASAATVIMYLVLRREGTRWSLPLAMVFAFGTNTWMISSQALWQHGTGELLIALALLLVAAPASSASTALLGAVCVFMAANRPPDALVACAIVCFIAWNRRRNALWLLAGAALPLAALLYYNYGFIGHIAGAYALLGSPGKFLRPSWSGVAGLLVSPTRGLLVFSPFFIFILVGLKQRLRSPDTKGLAIALSLAVAAQILLYSQLDWRAGHGWGPRWLTDLLPILIWMIAPAPLVLSALARSIFILLMAVSVGVQTIGAFWYTSMTDKRIFAGNPASMRAAWNPYNTPFLIELCHLPALGGLHHNARGSIDRVGSTQLPGSGKPPALDNGTLLEGWALINGRTPAEVLLLIDGIVIGSTRDFSPLTNVNEAMPTTSPSSWRVSANTLGVSPGERVLQLAVNLNGITVVREQRVLVAAYEPPENATQIQRKPVPGPELEVMAKRAAELLRERQDKYGFWLTSYTKGLRYEAPRNEMNTFLTSTLVDLISPIAQQQGLNEAVKRARRHLAAQIESSGLVRYHGLPYGPTIGKKLGCVITPDTDDTALTWRIAGHGADDPRRQPMLDELARYRDARGLYRTWLAPRKQYKGIDPGIDPNPTDIGIQMNLFLMLRELDPPAAQNLCTALKRSFWDEDVWIYYSKAPLLPYLRSVELQQLGCAIPLPAERLALPATGQEIWSEAVRRLTNTIASSPDRNTRQAIRDLLAHIGSEDFAQIRHSPPMLYHNDMSGSVSRFYWSEDFGYALWLRLYEAAGYETGHRHKPSS